MKVISGLLKGRIIKGYNIKGTRPTMDRVKMSVFSSIQSYIKDSVVLDLFAGSGNLGIESLSNGSKYCYFVDNNKECIKCIISNLTNFNIINKSKILLKDYERALKEFNISNTKFDIIFIDPPYKMQNINSIIDTITSYNLLNENGLLVLEFKYDNITIDNDLYKLLKSKKYGDKFVSIYKKIK